VDKKVDNRSDRMKEYVNKVAEKLGVPSDKLSAAMREIRKERIDQAITEKIEEAVKNGVITQAEAGPIREWWKSRPDGLQKLLGQMFGHRARMMGMRM
jgi:hypothetical protein